MKYSLHWLQQHLASPLPDITTLAREVTLRAFEVEEVEEKNGDTLMEIKVLPDRAHDALSHRGMAREIGGLLGIARKEQGAEAVTRDASVSSVRVTVEESALCPRYIATRIDGVTIGTTPKEIAEKIEAVGGRSINNIVDITNYVLFDIGQPLHAFDAEKVVGGITVRLAKSGETMTTLDNKDLTLVGTELVIADDEGVLALAGIKGGKKAEVTTSTTSIILECANFNPTLTRKTSQQVGIKTDAVKRYENGMTSAFAKEGCDIALALIAHHGGSGVKIGETTDIYPVKEESVSVQISAHEVNRLLGLSLTTKEVGEVLSRANLAHSADGEQFAVTIPEERLDLRITEDMVEEIGRHVGYEKIVSVLPKLPNKGIPKKRLYYANKVREFLVNKGFSEVFTYSFAKPGEGTIEVLYPVGKDRPYIRASLLPGIERALASNFYNTPLLGTEDVKIFEFGNVFDETKKEHTMLAFGVMGGTKKRWKELSVEFDNLLAEIQALLGVKDGISSGREGTPLKNVPYDSEEKDFDALIKDLPEPTSYQPMLKEEKEMRYQTLSAYPFIVRDIAIFVPQEVTESYIEALLKKEAGELVVRFSQFDKFQKAGEDRISYGYRMVFQSFEKTLTDDEVGKIMERVTAKCNAEPNWQVR